ncbi:hypothetical protein [Flammeovirga aprica]|uniref:Uncharacterized protein n=1 Tax=Flammeovirga aprica JL-4 TaxID=694437 RepID=A0A7X9RT14_9BACT|nr:hypothetical protein [Flammeovirga aprica]NME67786.1 hypothetical protein [Flammeovirga aprica JL-4]
MIRNKQYDQRQEHLQLSEEEETQQHVSTLTQEQKENALKNYDQKNKENWKRVSQQLKNSTDQSKKEETAPTQITLTSSVGAGGANLVSDVKKIQKKLMNLGFLSEGCFDEESVDLFKEKKDTDKVKDTDIPHTIEAIKSYEATVEYVGYADSRKKPSGKVTPAGKTLQLMNIQKASVSETQLNAIKQKRNSINIDVSEEIDLSKIEGNVGDIDDGNKVEDITLVQDALIELGILKFDEENSERSDAIFKKHPDSYLQGKESLKKEHLKLTIKAIEVFQNWKKIKHWRTKKVHPKFKENANEQWKKNGRKKKENFLENTGFTKGVVNKGDSTYLLLDAYKKFKLSFKANGKTQSYSFSNLVRSGDAVNMDGLSIMGKAKAQGVDLATIKKFGLTDIQAKALKYVSTHEGNFDAINSYDQAVISYGFIQFAGGGRSFNSLLALMKKDYPSTFKTYFQDYGIDVEYLEKNGKIVKSTIVAVDEITGDKLRGITAEDYIRSNEKLIGSLIMAGHDTKVQEAQIKLAANMYVKPAAKLSFRSTANVPHLKVVKKLTDGKTKQSTFLGKKEIDTYKKSADYKAIKNDSKLGSLTEGSLNLSGKKVNTVLTSAKSTTSLINMAINDGIGGAGVKVSKGVRDYIIEKKICTLDEIKSASEVEILKKVKKHVFKPKRIQAIIDESSI